MARKTARKKSATSQGPAPEIEPRLPAERFAALRAVAMALPEENIRPSPSRLGERIRWCQRIRDAAQRVEAELLPVPMDPEPDLSEGELAELTDRIDFLHQVEAELRNARGNPQPPELTQRIAEARALEFAVLDGLEHLFRKDPKLLRQIRDIRHGEGLADLMQDASDLWALWQQHKTLCRRLVKGEAQKLLQLVEMTNQLSQIAASTPAGRELRLLRDRAYTLVTQSVERIRTAAAYIYSDQPERLAAFAPFSQPRRPSSRKPRTPNGS